MEGLITCHANRRHQFQFPTAFAEGVGAMYIRHLDLSNNRILEEKTSVAILSKLDPFIIQKLDLSKNRLTPKSFKMLTKLVGESTNLLNLGLEER